MSKFYFSYFGNKYKEVKNILNEIDITKYSKIVEPFCGSAGFSRYIFNETDENPNYYLNDNDSILIKLLKDVKKNGIKKYIENIDKFIENNDNDIDKCYLTFKEMKKKEPTYDDIIMIKMITGNGNMMDFGIIKNRKTDDKYKIPDSFYKDSHVHLHCGNWLEYVNKYKDDPNTLIFLDPPYLSSFNSNYSSYKSKITDKNNILIDNTKLFIDILDLLKNSKAKIVFVINENAITKYIYKDYKKKYMVKLIKL